MGRILFNSTPQIIDRTLVINASSIDAAKQLIENFDELMSFAKDYPKAKWLKIMSEGEVFLQKMRLKTCPEKLSENEDDGPQ